MHLQKSKHRIRRNCCWITKVNYSHHKLFPIFGHHNCWIAEYTLLDPFPNILSLWENLWSNMVSKLRFLGGLGFKSICLHLFPFCYVTHSMYGCLSLHVQDGAAHEGGGCLGNLIYLLDPFSNSLIFRWSNNNEQLKFT